MGLQLDSGRASYDKPRTMAVSLFNKRFVIMAGKGGVGKSTLSAATALCAARRGRRVLVVELGGKEKTARLLGHDGDVGYIPTRVQENIDVINVQPEPALAEYGLMKLRFEKLYRAVFENTLIKSLTRMIPGMNELVLIGKAWHLEQEMLEGKPRWDMLVVDAPATGHGLSLLVLPHVILETVQSGPMAVETRKIRDLLVDPERTLMNIVTLPEEMPVNEALDLRKQMDSTLRIQGGALFVNRVWPTHVDDTQLKWLEQASTDQPAAKSAIATGRFFGRRARAQQQHIGRLEEHCDLPMIKVENQFSDTFDAETVKQIADQLDASPVLS